VPPRLFAVTPVLALALLVGVAPAAGHRCSRSRQGATSAAKAAAAQAKTALASAAQAAATAAQEAAAGGGWPQRAHVDDAGLRLDPLTP
jgi:hypothetical protein